MRTQRLVFASHGSLGDLVPFLEIGLELARRGHRVTIATHPAHRGRVRTTGLAFAPMRPDLPSDPAVLARFMEKHRGTGRMFTELIGPAIADSYADLKAATAGADLLVSVTLAVAAPIVAEKDGVPWVSAAFQPAMLYSAYDPPRLPPLPLIPWSRAAGWNRAVYRVAPRGIASWAEPILAFRASLGLPSPAEHPILRGQHSPRGVLALFSPLIGAPQPDWPEGTVQTGAILQSSGDSLAPAIDRFLSDGEPPIVVTLGASSARAPGDFFEVAIAAVARAGARALLLVGSDGESERLRSRASERVMICTRAPYERVFPRATLVVQPGGIGSLSLALAAGVPSLLVPFAHDQHDNAARAARLGIARIVARERWTVPRAHRLLRQIGLDNGMAGRARAVAGTIREEAGIVRAADAIEQLAAPRGLSADPPQSAAASSAAASSTREANER